MQHSATIQQGRDIVTLINTFTVEPMYQQAIVDSLSEVTERTTRYLPGFLGASVHQSLDGKYVANYVQWESLAHFQAMMLNPDMVAHVEQVTEMAISVLPILYAVAYVGAENARS